VKGHGLQYTKSAPSSNKQSPGRFTSQSGVVVQEETSIHTGGKQSGGPTSASTFGGVGSGRASEAVNFLQDIGNSSNDKAFGFEAGGTCFNSNSLLSAEQVCGVSSISANDLPDLQAPGSDETEADLLFNMPTNMMTFQDTVLLQQPAWSKIKESDTYQVPVVCCYSSLLETSKACFLLMCLMLKIPINVAAHLVDKRMDHLVGTGRDGQSPHE